MSQTSHDASRAGGIATGAGVGLSSGAADRMPIVWLNGAVLSCACPECHGPMSIRAWLMLGDCARCGASIELSLEVEQEVRRLLAEREAAQQAAAVVTPPEPRPLPKPKQQPVKDAPPQAAPAPPPPQLRRVPAADVPAGAARRAYELAQFGRAEVARRDLLSDLPAWLASLIFHLVLMLILGLLSYHDHRDSLHIVLSSVMGPRHEAGEPAVFDPKRDDLEFEDAGKPPEPELPPEVAQANKDAQELQEPLTAPDTNRPRLSKVVAALAKPTTERMFEGRDPRIRSSVVNLEGGTTYTEAAVARGLRWLAKHQNDDGSWSLHAFHRAGDCDGQCTGHGAPSDTAGTALALLPFLGSGQTHLHGRYTRQVGNALRYLKETQREDGDLRGEGVGQMYAHGQCAIVLCEAYALTGDEQLRAPAQRAVDFIVEAQHPAGGWRYQPGERGDMSVVGWQLMALRSARMALLDVPEKTFSRAALFLDSVQIDSIGARYGYQRGREVSPAMTAEALLCRQYLGWPADEPGMQRGVEWMAREHPPRRGEPNVYYWYYATQVLHHLGGPAWNTWNEQMRTELVAAQETEGHMAGSWSPRGGVLGGHDVHTGGRLYMTSLAICTLEVYYRYLPIYRSIDVVAK